MGYDNLKTIRERLIEIETEKAKVEEWASGSSRVKYRAIDDLNKEYSRLISLVKSESDLDKTIVELTIIDNNSSRNVYAI